MVRKAHLRHDDEFAGFDPPDERPDFDGLDDLLFDTPEPRRRNEQRPSWSRSSKPQKANSERDSRRHLAGADWPGPTHLPPCPKDS